MEREIKIGISIILGIMFLLTIGYIIGRSGYELSQDFGGDIGRVVSKILMLISKE